MSVCIIIFEHWVAWRIYELRWASNVTKSISNLLCLHIVHGRSRSQFISSPFRSSSVTWIPYREWMDRFPLRLCMVDSNCSPTLSTAISSKKQQRQYTVLPLDYLILIIALVIDLVWNCLLTVYCWVKFHLRNRISAHRQTSFIIVAAHCIYDCMVDKRSSHGLFETKSTNLFRCTTRA
jgi:hypothetical protein